MKKQAGMRPLDLPVLIKLALAESHVIRNKDLSIQLGISASEITESLNRSKAAGLVDHNKISVNRQRLFEFICHGFRYVFPAQKGSLTIGIPTSIGHEFMNRKFPSSEIYVWPDFEGTARGTAIEPLYKNQVKAAQQDPRLYKILALMDVIRLERLREVNVATAEIKRVLLNE